MSTGLATIKNGEALEAEVVHASPVVTTPSALAPIIRAEMDAAILLAKQYPRSITNFLDRALSYATLTRSTAAQCCYSKPRAGGKPDEGPSVRLAEIVAATYGNLRVDARIIEETQRYVVAQAVAQDLETNNTWRSEVRRGIWGKNGRYTDDMINTVCNAAISIASRNVVFRVVPRAIWWPIYEECRRLVMSGEKGKTVVEQREDWLAFCREQGFRDGEVFAALGVRGADDVGLEQIAQLAGFQTAVQTGEATWESIFRPEAFAPANNATPGAPQAPKADRLAEALERKTAEKGKGKAQAAPPADDAWPAGRE